MIERFVGWIKDTFIYKDTCIMSSTWESVVLKDVRKFKEWKSSPFNTYYHTAYINQDGVVYVQIQTYFINLKEVKIKKYKSMDDFNAYHFPPRTMVSEDSIG